MRECPVCKKFNVTRSCQVCKGSNSIEDHVYNIYTQPTSASVNNILVDSCNEEFLKFFQKHEDILHLLPYYVTKLIWVKAWFSR